MILKKPNYSIKVQNKKNTKNLTVFIYLPHSSSDLFLLISRLCFCHLLCSREKKKHSAGEQSCLAVSC